MAVVTIRHNPELTKEEVFRIFEKHFGGRYQVYEGASLLFRDFTVKKSGWTGVAVALQQEREETKIVFGGFSPNLLARLAMGATLGVLSYLFWNDLTDEVRTFIVQAPEFR